LSGNFHPVVSGEVYRSAQPTPTALAGYIKEHGIRSIINLRGENSGTDWYDAEVAEAKTQGVAHYDFGISARKQLDQQRAQELIDLMNKAEKPVLIHCQGGADRSGLASALYVAAIAKAGEEAAERQISLRYGHISLPITAAYAMDRTFEALEPWLGFSGS
jgi:protein tyrosine/serine phosphatase